MAHPEILCNQVDQIPTLPGITSIDVAGGVEVTIGNLVLDARVEDNLVGGVRNDASFFANLGDGASGNAIEGYKNLLSR